MKDKEWDPLAVKCFSTGSICEFEDGKARPHLGVVISVEVGAKKGGAVYEVADAKDKKHKVYAKNVHAVYPSDPMTKSGTPPAEVLDDYLNVAGCTPTQLGVELEHRGADGPDWLTAGDRRRPFVAREPPVTDVGDEPTRHVERDGLREGDVLARHRRRLPVAEERDS